MATYKKQGIPCNNCKRTGLAVRKEGRRRVRHQCPECLGEGILQDEPQRDPADKEIDNLSMLIRRLTYALKRAKPDHSLIEQTHQYMTDMGHWSVSDAMRGTKDDQ